MTDSAIDLVDAHCHIDLFPDPPALARLVNEQRIHTIAVTNAPSVFAHTERLASGSVYLHPAIGLHPELVATHAHELERFWPALMRTRFVGEVGLDYTTSDQVLRARQRDVFTKVLDRCAALGGKTITVHSRRASSDTIGAIGDRFPGRVVLHWFTGSRRELERAAKFGLYFSVNVAMVQAQKGRELIDAMPRDRVLTESDGPFVRLGARNADPTSARGVILYLARTWRCAEEEARKTIRENLGQLE